MSMFCQDPQSNKGSAAGSDKNWVELSFKDVDPQTIIGMSCKVFWPLDKGWYSGSVMGFNPKTKAHHVEYENGECEDVILSSEMIKFYLSHEEMQSLKLRQGFANGMDMEGSAARSVKNWVELSFKDVDPQTFIGMSCKVYWPLDKKWYQGSVEGFNPKTKKHRVHHEDGEIECLTLSNEKIKFYLSNEEMQSLKPRQGAANGMDMRGDDNDEMLKVVPATLFCNFNDERSRDKLKNGQIWALYCKLDDFPRSYAWIESVELFPVFKLTIKWLESCQPPIGVVPWVDKRMPVCCGTFKVAFGEGAVFSNSISFCHQVNGAPSGSNSYTIYPRTGEVWALHSKFCPDLMCSNLKKCEYYMVEILELVADRWIIVSVLRSVTGFKTVFKAKERGGLHFTAIPWIELYRFSHQVPSFMLKEARYGELRGCLELDPRSIPVHLCLSN